MCPGMLSPGLGSEGPAQAPPCDTAHPTDLLGVGEGVPAWRGPREAWGLRAGGMTEPSARWAARTSLSSERYNSAVTYNELRGEEQML